jgi:hypothetical protein
VSAVLASDRDGRGDGYIPPGGPSASCASGATLHHGCDNNCACQRTPGHGRLDKDGDKDGVSKNPKPDGDCDDGA